MVSANGRDPSSQSVSKALPFERFNSTIVLALVASGRLEFPDIGVECAFEEIEFGVLLGGRQLWTRCLTGRLVETFIAGDNVTFWSGVFELGVVLCRLSWLVLNVKNGLVETFVIVRLVVCLFV